MHILVCIKGIIDPDVPTALFDVDEEAKAPAPLSGVRTLMSPFDKQAIEGALRIRDTRGAVRISLLCMGPDSSRTIIKEGQALGADEAYLLTDPLFEIADSFTTARTLAAAITTIGDVDLVLTGRQSADWDSGVVGGGIAELLNVPAITLAASIEIDGQTVRVRRALVDGAETVEAPLPAVVTVAHEMGAPRKASLRETMRAASKPVTVWTASDIGLAADEIGNHGRRAVPERLYIPLSDVKCEYITGETPAAVASALITRLQEEKLL
ncbi:MAG: electron transfer flavoprotein subunit beta/FixA family protein [Rhodobacteraceae bacterium]|nr:electron transfer flavoprotein subunit beta/FixA family protein [Paracoccaceae bacterium]